VQGGAVGVTEYSKNWCPGFCRTCGTGCAEHSEELYLAHLENARLIAALNAIATQDRDAWCAAMAKAALTPTD
jgi:hypothetical protein